MARVTTDDLLAAILALGKEDAKRPPGNGWKTVAAMAKERGLGISAMRQRLRLAMERGLKVERFTGSDYDMTGRLVKQSWLRMKK